ATLVKHGVNRKDMSGRIHQRVVLSHCTIRIRLTPSFLASLVKSRTAHSPIKGNSMAKWRANLFRLMCDTGSIIWETPLLNAAMEFRPSMEASDYQDFPLGIRPGQYDTIMSLPEAYSKQMTRALKKEAA